jgi:hypothetical protein
MSRRHRSIEPHQFRRPAADIKQDHAFRARIDQRRTSGRGQQRLGFPINDFELDADLVANPRKKFLAVAGGPAGFRRN